MTNVMKAICNLITFTDDIINKHNKNIVIKISKKYNGK